MWTHYWHLVDLSVGLVLVACEQHHAVLLCANLITVQCRAQLVVPSVMLVFVLQVTCLTCKSESQKLDPILGEF